MFMSGVSVAINVNRDHSNFVGYNPTIVASCIYGSVPIAYEN